MVHHRLPDESLAVGRHSTQGSKQEALDVELFESLKSFVPTLGLQGILCCLFVDQKVQRCQYAGHAESQSPQLPCSLALNDFALHELGTKSALHQVFSDQDSISLAAQSPITSCASSISFTWPLERCSENNNKPM